MIAMRPPKPGNKFCKKCGRGFFPEWYEYECRWIYRGIGEDRICSECKKAGHRREKIEEYLARAGVPPKYIQCSFENFRLRKEARQAVSIAREYVKEPNGNLVIYGPCGTGKTHLAVAIARELVLRGKQVVFTSVPKLLFEVRRTFGDYSGGEEQRIMKYTTCEFLVLDDLGVEKPTEWSRQTLDYIIYERDNNLKPMVVTSNLSLDEISESCSDRVGSRLLGRYGAVYCGGTDYRADMVRHVRRRSGLRATGNVVQKRCSKL